MSPSGGAAATPEQIEQSRNLGLIPPSELRRSKENENGIEADLLNQEETKGPTGGKIGSSSLPNLGVSPEFQVETTAISTLQNDLL